MEITLKAGDSLQIPEGCKAIVKDNVVVFEKEKKEETKTQEFKDGDVLTSLFDSKVVFIFKEDESKQKDNRNGYYVCHIYVSCSIGYVIDVPTKESLSFCGHKDDVRLATNEEKQILFDKMKEHGLRWNAEEKKVEKIRWRAEDGYGYFYVDSQGRKTAKNEECKFVDKDRFAFGNYFRTIDQADEAAKRVKEALMKYHEEIGE